MVDAKSLEAEGRIPGDYSYLLPKVHAKMMLFSEFFGYRRGGGIMNIGGGGGC